MLLIKRLSLAGILAMLIVTDVAAQRGRREPEKYQNADLGISLMLPGEWTRVPQNPDAPWTAARFISDTRTSDSEAHAHVRIVVLPQDPDRARTWLSPDPSDPYSIRPEGKGCSTYRAFVEGTTPNIQPPGKKFDVQEVGKGTSSVGPYHDFAVRECSEDWFLRRARIFEREAIHVAVEVSMQKLRKDDLEKLWKDVLDSIRPLSTQKRADAAPDRWLSPRLCPEDYPAWRALPVGKRQELRTRSENLWSQAEKRHTGPGWQFVQSKRFSVLSPRGTPPNPYIATLETFAGYLDGVLGPLSDDRARRWVLRICTDSEQRDAFETWPHPTSGFTDVVMTVADQADPLSYGAAQRVMFWTYLHEKNALLGSVLPSWLVEGLSRTLYYSSRVHGDTVDFDSDDWARKYGRELEIKGSLAPLRTIVTLDSSAFHDFCVRQDKQDCRMDVQCQLVVSFLLMKEQRVPQLKGFLTRYLQALADACATVADAPDRRTFLDAAYAKVNAQIFGADDQVWRQIDKAFAAYVRG